MAKDSFAHLDEDEEGAQIQVSGDSAFEKAKKLLEVAEIDKDEVEYVNIEMTKEPQPESSPQLEEETPPEDRVPTYDLREADKQVLSILLEFDDFRRAKPIYEHGKKRFSLAEGTIQNRIYDLVDFGYIEKREDPNDGRYKQYKATTKAEQDMEDVDVPTTD